MDTSPLILATRKELAPHMELTPGAGDVRQQVEAWWIHAYHMYPAAFDKRIQGVEDSFVLAIIYAWALHHQAEFEWYEPQGQEIEWMQVASTNLAALGMEIPSTEIRLSGGKILYLEAYRQLLGWSGWAFTEVPDLSDHILYSKTYLQSCRTQDRADNVVSLIIHEQLHCALVERTGRCEILQPLVLAVEEGAVSLLSLVAMLTSSSGALPYEQVARYATSEGYQRQVAQLLDIVPKEGFAHELVSLASENRRANDEEVTAELLNQYAQFPASVDEWRERFGSASW